VRALVRALVRARALARVPAQKPEAWSRRQITQKNLNKASGK